MTAFAFSDYAVTGNRRAKSCLAVAQSRRCREYICAKRNKQFAARIHSTIRLQHRVDLHLSLPARPNHSSPCLAHFSRRAAQEYCDLFTPSACLLCSPGRLGNKATRITLFFGQVSARLLASLSINLPSPSVGFAPLASLFPTGEVSLDALSILDTAAVKAEALAVVIRTRYCSCISTRTSSSTSMTF